MSSFKDEETEIKSRVCNGLIIHTHICVCYSKKIRDGSGMDYRK